MTNLLVRLVVDNISSMSVNIIVFQLNSYNHIYIYCWILKLIIYMKRFLNSDWSSAVLRNTVKKKEKGNTYSALFVILTNFVIKTHCFTSNEGPTLEMLDFTIRIDRTPTFLYFDLFYFCCSDKWFFVVKISTMEWINYFVRDAIINK